MTRRAKGWIIILGVTVAAFVGFWLWAGPTEAVLSVLMIWIVAWAAESGSRKAKEVDAYREEWL
jgi:hypothetical protein